MILTIVGIVIYLLIGFLVLCIAERIEGAECDQAGFLIFVWPFFLVLTSVMIVLYFFWTILQFKDATFFEKLRRKIRGF